ncbi:MAG: hypothetical protein KAR22_17185 [Gammaproteobacteria bacterium]|nr:hypothetical protein [Gammaproteobacteria bacterium]
MSDDFQAPRWQPNTYSLWPTVLIRRTFTGCEEPNRALIDLVEKVDRENDQLTASHWQNAELLNVDDDGIRWLRKGIDETIRAYLDEVGMNYGIGWKTNAWANINRLGDYHAPHNHAWSYLSGTYYVKVPESPEGAVPGGTASSAGISFYDPRAAVNMLARDGEALSRREFAVRPSAGTMLLWHSSIYHSVHANLSEDTRISISFNIALAWSDHYLGEE